MTWLFVKYELLFTGHPVQRLAIVNGVYQTIFHTKIETFQIKPTLTRIPRYDFHGRLSTSLEAIAEVRQCEFVLKNIF